MTRPIAPALDLPSSLGLEDEITRVHEFLTHWTEQADSEVIPLLNWQLMETRPKHFRPVTLVACHCAVSDRAPDPRIMRRAAALEVIHNVSLVIDDILDRSRYRRGKLSLHCKFGSLPAMMTAGYMFAGAELLVARDPYALTLLSRLFQRLAVAECSQWRLRREPLGVEDWRLLAQEDTGSMFETAACLGTGDERLRRFGQLLGMLYHGCDDVADVRGSTDLGGGGHADLRDGILTLPPALALRDPELAARYRNPDPTALRVLGEAFRAVLPAAEAYLDQIAADARSEALSNAARPERLLSLIEHTRTLSSS